MSGMRIGAQLYTVRDFCRELDDFERTLGRISDIGYRFVQVSGTCAFEPDWLAERLKRYGLSCTLTHTPGDRIVSDPEGVAKEHDIFGCKYIGLGWNAFNLEENDTPEEFIKRYTSPAKRLKECGKYFMYHNHDQEFKRCGEEIILSMLQKGFEPKDMGFIIDTFWVTAGGADPAEWIYRLRGRVPCIHLKDFAYGRRMAVIGEGNINFPRIFEQSEAAGVEYMFVEQDDCNGEDPFDCLRRSYEYLKANGFE